MTTPEGATRRRASSPTLSGKPPAYGDAAKLMASMGLEFLAPAFEPYDDAVRVLAPATALIDVAEASYTAPEVVNIWFESFGGVEPSIDFAAFVKGVAVAGMAVAADDRDKLIGGVQALAEAVLHTGEPRLPAIDARFQDAVLLCVEAIFANNEPISWRALLAFLQGSFWALGFVRDSQTKVGRGKGAVSPAGWVQRLNEHFAQLAHLPE